MAASATNPLITLLDLGHRARTASSANELAFLLVNDSRRLLDYRQACLWFEQDGVRTLSGAMQIEGSAPYVQWLEKLCRYLSRQFPEAQPHHIVLTDLPPELQVEWAEWLPREAIWQPLPASPNYTDVPPGGLLLAGENPFSDETLLLAREWLDMWQHAWRNCRDTSAISGGLLRWRLARWWKAHAGDKWWKRRPVQVAICLALALFLPIRLSVLAPGELVPADPAVIRAPLDGVIGKILVSPNERVKKDQILFEFEDAPIVSRLDVSRQALATAEAEYRQFAQMAVHDPKSKEELATLLGKIGERRAELDFLAGQLQRSRVVSPKDGIALFDDPSELIGRPVQTGERIMRVAHPSQAEIEAWLSIGDAIPLADGSPVSLYLSANPLAAVQGRLRYVNHDASPRPDGTFAYRIRATLNRSLDQRIGLKGTAKLRGGWVPLGYWILRRPLIAARQFFAL
jgi:multidrug resistance efflux pump